MLSVKPWRAVAVMLFCFVLLVGMVSGGLLSGVGQHFGITGFRQPDDFGNLVLGTLTFQGVACGLMFVFWWWHGIGWRAGFGFSGPQLQRGLWLAVRVFVLVLLAVWLLQAASVFTLTWLGHPPDDQATVRLIESARSWWVRAYLGIFAVVLAPVAEEFVFRGLLYPFIKQLGWPRLACISVSLLFAVIHFDVATFLPLLLLALVLTWLYEKTDNLLAPIVVHALFNAANLAMLVVKHLYLDPQA